MSHYWRDRVGDEGGFYSSDSFKKKLLVSVVRVSYAKIKTSSLDVFRDVMELSWSFWMFLAGNLPSTFQSCSSFIIFQQFQHVSQSHLVGFHVLQDAIGRLPSQRHVFVGDAAHAAAALQGPHREVLTRRAEVAPMIAGPEVVEDSWGDLAKVGGVAKKMGGNPIAKKHRIHWNTLFERRLQ